MSQDRLAPATGASANDNQEKRLRDGMLSLAYQSAFSRRDILRGVMALAGSAVLFGGATKAYGAPSATQETLDALSAAEAEADAVEAQLNEIAAQFQALTVQQSQTLDQIEDVQLQIDDTQKQIDEKEEELQAKQDMLAGRATASYKSGGNDALNLLLSSRSFDELISNVVYIDALNKNDQEAIAQINEIRDELAARKQELEGQKADLEVLREEQQRQLTEMQNKQAEVQEVLAGLDAEVQALIEQRDAEILAAAEAEAAAQKAAQEAAQQQQQRPSGGGGGNVYVPDGGTPAGSGGLSGAQQRVVNACYSTPSPGVNLCAMWVSQVFSNAGLGYPGGNANDMYFNWCTYSSTDQLQVGMIVAVSTYSKNWAGQVYGHVGIYVGDGIVMENILGYINSNSLTSWCSYYGDTVAPRWGWVFGQNLAAM